MFSFPKRGLATLLLGLTLFSVACGGTGSEDKTPVSSPTQVASKTVETPVSTVSTTASPTTATALQISDADKASLVKKVDSVGAGLVALSQPGSLKSKLDKARYLGVKDQSNIDLVQDELAGRLLLEELIGKSASLDQYRGNPGSNPPPEGGYLAAIKAAIESGNIFTVGGTGPKDPVRVLGADRLVASAIFVLQGYLPADRYPRLMPTDATRDKFDTKSTPLGVIDLPGWSDAYFTLVQVQRSLDSLKVGK